MKLGESIKKYRKEIQMTQRDLAVQSRLSFSMVSKLESGEQSNPSFKTIKKISNALHIEPAELLEEKKSIEDQIDEYIAYKRGLKSNRFSSETASEKISDKALKTTPKSTEKKTPETKDINFLRKLSAINTVPKPEGTTDEECLSFLHDRPELKRLLTASKNASKDEIEFMIHKFESSGCY